MANKNGTVDYEQVVDSQAQQILEVLAQVEAGNLDVSLEIPEEAGVLSDVALALSRVVEKWRQSGRAVDVRREWGAYVAEEPAGFDSPDPSWQETLVEAIEKQTLVQKTNGENALAVPIQYSDEVIGVLGFTAEESAGWDDEELAAVEAIAEQVGLALENQRLFDQTQRTLQETTELYDVTAKLNEATSVDELLAALVEPSIARDAFSGSLVEFETGADGSPTWATLTASWNPEPDSDSTMPIGSRFYLPEFPLSKLWLSNPDEAMLIGDPMTDPRVDPTTRGILQYTQVMATVILPLSIGSRWLGLAVISWQESHRFTDADQRFYNAITAQGSVVYDNILLLADTQRRALLLARLAEMETALSQAQTEDEIVTAVLGTVSEPTSASLQFLEMGPNNRPVVQIPVSMWRNNEFDPNNPQLGQRIPMSASMTDQSWIDNYEIVYLENAQEDARYTEQAKQTMARYGIQAMVMIPLRSGGAWQATFTFVWSEPHQFTADEKFLLRRLQESLAAVVARRRASLAQQVALSETATLYTASASLNAAQTYDDVLDVLNETTVLGDYSHFVSLNFFDQPWDTDRMPETIIAVAATGAMADDLPDPLPRYYQFTDLPAAEYILKADKPTVIENVMEDPVMGPNIEGLLFDQFKGVSALFVPMTVAGQWLGFIDAYYPDTKVFADKDLTNLMTLAGQAALTMQTIRLVDETQSLFQRAEARASELAVLNAMARDLTTVLDVQSVMETVYEYTGRLMDANNFYIAWHNQQTNILSFPVAVEDGHRTQIPERSFGTGLTEYTMRLGEPMLVEYGVDEWLQAQGYESAGSPYQSWLGMPLIINQRVQGVIAARSLIPEAYSEIDLDVMSAIASQATIAIQTAQLFEQAQQRARRERILREVTEKVRSSSDVDAVMQIAVQEVGRALGRPAFVRLQADS